MATTDYLNILLKDDVSFYKKMQPQKEVLKVLFNFTIW